jgi:hypothetical protein
MEFARTWQRVAFAAQIILLFAAVALLVRGGSLFSSLGCITAALAFQIGLWVFAPIQHQSPTSVRARNSFYLVCSIALLAFAAWMLLRNVF